MTRASAHGLTAEPAPDWRTSAACKRESADLFFPQSHTGQWLLAIDEAKAVCRRCPVIEACARWAFETRQEFGIWGGLTENERRKIRRNASRQQLTIAAAAASHAEARQARAELDEQRTIQSVFEAHTRPMWGEHLSWVGPTQPRFRGQVFTPRRLCFIADRGYLPHGPVRPECGSSDCMQPKHLTDQAERTRARAAG